MALYCLISWTPAFYMRKYGLTPTEAGYMLGTVMLVANTLGVFCAGWLNDWFIQKGRKDAPMITGIIGIIGLIIPMIAFTQVSELWLSVTLLVPAMFFASFPMPISTTAMQMLAPNQIRIIAGHPLALRTEGIYLEELLTEDLIFYPKNDRINFSTQIQALFAKQNLVPKNIRLVDLRRQVMAL